MLIQYDIIMKKLSTLVLSGSIILSLFFAGCKKDVTAAVIVTIPKTKTELISSGTWKFSKAMFGSIDVSSGINLCQRDNILTFQAGGGGSIDEGATKCNSGDPQTTTFTWNFTSSESVLHVSAVLFAGGTTDYNVVEISETKLVGSQTMNGQVVTVTFIH
jgi:hypothetical protein